MAKKPNLRLLLTGDMANMTQAGTKFKAITGGMLVQSVDNGHISKDDLQIVKIAPTQAQIDDMLFAWKVAKAREIKCNYLCER